MISEATVIFWYRVGWQAHGSGESLLFTLTLHTVNENIRSRLMMARNLRENKSPIEKDKHDTVMGFALAERHTSALVSSLRRTLSHRHLASATLPVGLWCFIQEINKTRPTIGTAAFLGVRQIA